MQHRTSRAPTNDWSGLVSREESSGLDAPKDRPTQWDVTRSRYGTPAPAWGRCLRRLARTDGHLRRAHAEERMTGLLDCLRVVRLLQTEGCTDEGGVVGGGRSVGQSEGVF